MLQRNPEKQGYYKQNPLRERTFNYDHELCHSMLSDSDDDILLLLKVFSGRMNRCFVHLP